MAMNEQSIGVTENATQHATNGLSFARQAESCLDGGDAARAAELCVRGLKRFPGYLTARLILGRCYLEQRRYNEALTEFRRACRIDRRCPAALRLIADVLTKQQATDRAGAIYAHLLENDPDNVDLQYLSSSVPGAPAVDVLAAAGVVEMPVAPSQDQTPPPEQAGETAVHDIDLEEDEVDIEEITGSHEAPDTPPQPSAPPPPPDSAQLNDLIESGETIALAPDANAGVSADDITGQDVSYRIDALFGEEEAVRGPGEKNTGKKESADPLTELFASGQLDDSSRIDTGRFSMEEFSAEQIESPDEGALKDEDAFGATMAFDHSMLVGEDEEQEQDTQSDSADDELDLEPEEYDLSDDIADDDEQSMSGLSGADVSSRLDEMFDMDDSDMGGETIQLTEEDNSSRPTGIVQSDGTHVIDNDQHGDTRGETADTAQTEQSPLLPVDSQTDDSDQSSALTGQTAIIEPDSSNQPQTDQHAQEVSDDTFEIELEDDSAATVADGETSDLLGMPTVADDDQVVDFDQGGQQEQTPAQSLADDVIQPTDESGGLTLDQEMSFGDSDQQSLDDMMTAPMQGSNESSESDAPTGFIVTDEFGVDSTGNDEQELTGEYSTDDTLEFAQGPQDQPPDDSSGDTLDGAASVVEGTDKSDDDLFGDTSPHASTPEPQSKQERAEEAQTLEFARDELEDLVALQGDSQEQSDDDDDDDDGERLGDTTTMGALVEDEAGEISFQQVTFDDTSAFKPAEPDSEPPPDEDTDKGGVHEADDIDFSSSGLIEAPTESADQSAGGAETHELAQDQT
ncbi:MAG: tetratricopeptide repeat protein, partial [Chitinivibrionales bacterium]|nr:tetratricopeptide repeat protein [Chitinivibrionales bacterium]